MTRAFNTTAHTSILTQWEDYSREKGLTIYEFCVKQLVKWSGKEDNYTVQLFSDIRRIV